MTDASTRKHFDCLVAVALLVLVGGSVLHATGQMAWGCDDAYISYRYARNLVNGNGLVYNPGERVEGYSNFLYVLLMAPAFFFLGDAQAYLFSLGLNLVFISAAFLVFYFHIRDRLPWPWTRIACVLFAICPFMWWAVGSGLETPLIVLIQLLIWIAVSRVETSPSPRGIALLCIALSLSILARADGFIAPAIAIVYLVVKRHHRTAACAMAATALTFGIYVSWRLAYYGYPLPNTYYAKVAGPLAMRVGNGFDQLMEITFKWGMLPQAIGLLLPLVFLPYDALRRHKGLFAPLVPIVLIPYNTLRKYKDLFPSLLPIILGAYNALRKCTRLASPLRPILVLPYNVFRIKDKGFVDSISFEMFFALSWLIYWHYIGGDFLGERFVLFLFPLGTYALFKHLAPRVHKRAAILAIAAGLGLFQLTPLAAHPHFNYTFKKYDAWKVTGQFLRDRYPGNTIAVDAAGKIPFFSGLYTIDMLGLNDKHIGHLPIKRFRHSGHNKWDAEYVLDRRPNLIAAFAYVGTDLQWGLNRSRYARAGYRLAYVVYLHPLESGKGPIIDVRDLSEEEQEKRIRDGLAMAILEHFEKPPDLRASKFLDYLKPEEGLDKGRSRWSNEVRSGSIQGRR